MAKKIGVAESTYREWESGRSIRGEVGYIALADLFGVGISELILGERGSNAWIAEKLDAVEDVLRNIRINL